MRKALDNLSVWFENIGVFPAEVPFFIKDVFSFMDQKGYTPVNILNQELETLGWGIQIMDETAYKQMIFLYRNKKIYDLERYSSMNSDYLGC